MHKPSYFLAANFLINPGNDIFASDQDTVVNLVLFGDKASKTYPLTIISHLTVFLKVLTPGHSTEVISIVYFLASPLV